MGFLGLCSCKWKMNVDDWWWLDVPVAQTGNCMTSIRPFFRNNARNDEDANNLSTKTWRLYAPRWKTVSNLNQFCDQWVKLPKPCGISFLALAWVTHCDVEHPVGLVWNWSAYNLQTWTISSKIAIKASRTDPCNLLQFVCWQNAWNVMNLMLPTTKWFPCNRPPAIALGAVTKILAFPNKNYRRNFLRNW